MSDQQPVTEFEDIERYRDALRALESASGRVVARVEFRWERAPDQESGMAVITATASSLETEQMLAKMAVELLKATSGGEYKDPEEEKAEEKK